MSDERRPVTAINQDLDPALLGMIFRRSLWIILLLGVVSAAAAFLFLRYTTPTFETFSVIQLTKADDDKKDYLNQGSFFDLNLARELELLRSPVFLQRVIDTLPLDVTYYRKGAIMSSDNYNKAPYYIKIEKVNPLIFGVPIHVDFNEDRTVTVRFEIDETKETETINLNTSRKFGYFELTVVWRAPDFYYETNDFHYFIINDPESLNGKYLPGLEIEIENEGAKTIKIAYTDVNSFRASDMVNAVAMAYESFYIDSKQESAYRMLTYIDETLGLIKDKLEEADSSLKSYQRKYGLDGPTTELTTAGDFGKLLELQKQIEELRLTLQVTRTVYQKILDKSTPVGEAIILASQVQNSPGVASLVQQIQNMLLQRELMQYNFQESSNQIKRLDFHIDVIRGRMAKAVEYQLESLDFKTKENEQRIKDLESKLFIEKSIADQIELARLERVYEVNEKYYDELIQQKAEFSLAREGYTPDYRVLRYSRPNDTPVSPNKKLVVGGSFVGWFKPPAP